MLNTAGKQIITLTWIRRKLAHLNILVHDMINLLYYEYWTDKQKYLCVYILLIFQNITQIVKTNYSFNESKLAVKNYQALLRGVMSKHHAGFYYLNWLYSFKTEYKIKSHKNKMKMKIFVALQCLLKTLEY